MKISAYIPACNNAVTLARAMDSVRQQARPVAELFVIDDGSVDDSAGIARDLGCRVIVNARTLGRGAVRARAMLEAAHELVLSCDATLALPVEFTARAAERFQDERVAGVMGRVVPERRLNAVDRWRARHLFKAEQPARVEEAASLATGGALLRRAQVLAAGNFDAQCREGEDAELGRRLLARGAKVVLDPELRLRPLSRNTVGQVLERYWRWNVAPAGPVGLGDYWRQLGYSLKVMVYQDLRQRDPAAAVISLLCPHYVFWKSSLHRPGGYRR